jgi:hypothetical protein
MLAHLRGEPPLWTGRPDARVWLGQADLLLVPMTVVWAGFAVFWNVMAWRGRAPVPFRLFGIPFLLIGAYLVVGRFFVKRRRKQRSEYAITADRAVICDGRGRVRDVPLANTTIEQSLSRDGRHLTVTFGPVPGGRGWGFGYGGRSMPANSGMDGFGPGSTPPAFFDVADVVGLEAALGSVRRG